jgi:hypothetical protein
MTHSRKWRDDALLDDFAANPNAFDDEEWVAH